MNAVKQPTQNSKSPKGRPVYFLHKLTEMGRRTLHRVFPKTVAPKAAAMSCLAVGATFRFPGSGTRYTVLSSGAVVRTDPKPYKNRAEQKRFLKARRADREAAMANGKLQMAKGAAL